MNDTLRAPFSFVSIAIQLILLVLAFLLRRRHKIPKWVSLLLLWSLALPLASFISTIAVWRAGAGVAALAVVIATTAFTSILIALGIKRSRDLMTLLAVTVAFGIVDLLAGAPAQIDSLIGYTSVAAGRFYGIGNLGFSVMASCAFLLAGMVADRYSKWMAGGILAVVIVFVGHPALGGDIGGVLSLIPASFVFILMAAGRRIKRRHVPLIAFVAVAGLAVFALVDLATGPGQRTHLGDLVAKTVADPLSLLLVLRRKASLAITLGVAHYWGIVVPAGLAVFVAMRKGLIRGWVEMTREHPSLKAGLDALLVAAALGSVLNDSGLAVAGVMMAIGIPWSLLLASRRIAS